MAANLEGSSLKRVETFKRDLEEYREDAQVPTTSAIEMAYDEKFRNRVLWKIDLHLLPMLGALYTIAVVDRSNISVARISGLDEDVGLDAGNNASIALLVFFIGYIIFELPSNMLIHRVGAANWLAGIALAWGLVSLGIGFLQNWIGLAICRAILGVLEAGFFPGSPRPNRDHGLARADLRVLYNRCVYLVSSWYRRYEVQKRLAGFWLTATTLTAFANILAYGLIQIAHHTTYKGWRWIFIIEGAFTCVLAILSWFVIVEFPDSDRNKFLSPEEKAFVQARLAEDRGVEEREKVTWQVIYRTTIDWQVWAYSLMYMAGAVGYYAFSFFLPIILRKSLGYSLALSFILSAPPALFAAVEAYLVSYVADKTKKRGIFVVFQGLMGIVGLCMTGFLKHPTPRYVGTFLGIAGTSGLVVTTLAWQANNIRGDAKRAVATAVLISMSGVGGIYSSLVFRQRDAPNYLPGIIAVMAICCAAVATACVSIVVLSWYNKKADEGARINENLEGFRYTI
ncbi:hypothetical protein AYL99_08778 [Fonsecaea erecta]|uniref:Major facilitator superfamily (MFS) profile domain-containing protein n=1 Tax=Fonsecaea erecta TaxID=1367422 RepID=A0A178ZB20_9EURO|nr:hypothetical protein AYL99_08778 [Fonsecaea erecta]OAP56666.1 hypothetical protein AYL99_08778 [Fonsecaea erecta]